MFELPHKATNLVVVIQKNTVEQLINQRLAELPAKLAHNKITVEAINAYEQEYDLVLDPEYKEFLLKYNGEVGSDRMVYGISPSHKMQQGVDCYLS